MRFNSISRSCEVCGTAFLAKPSEIRRGHGRFCSLTCYGETLRIDPETRFWSRVDKGTAPDSCWLWTGPKDRDGYGLFSLCHHAIRAHRYSWELTNGPIPDGLFVLHDCPDGDNPSCVRPDHLWLGTNTENIRDASVKGRLAFGDRNAARLYPERWKRGDEHWARLHPERLPHGEQNHAAKLTAADVLAIRAAHQSQDSLAAQYHVSQAVISAVIRRKTWKHIP